MMTIALRDLHKFADCACFLTYSGVSYQGELDWLKPYVLLYDYFLFPYCETGLQRDRIRVRWPKIGEWLMRNALFLDQYEGMSHYGITADFSMFRQFPPDIQTVLSAKAEVYKDISILDPPEVKQQLPSLDVKSVKSSWDEIWNREYRTQTEDLILLEDVFSALHTLQVSLSGGPPGVVDPVISWVVRQIFNADITFDQKAASFGDVLIRNVPDFRHLSWDAILSLRKSRYRKTCLTHLRNIARDPSRSMQEETGAALWRLVTDAFAESSIPKSVIMGVAGHLPSLPVNPVGIYTSLKDMFKAISYNKRYGWLFYIAQIRQKADRT